MARINGLRHDALEDVRLERLIECVRHEDVMNERRVLHAHAITTTRNRERVDLDRDATRRFRSRDYDFVFVAELE